MILTKEHVEQIRRIMVDGDAAFDEEQALFDALDTIDALQTQVAILEKSNKGYQRTAQTILEIKSERDALKVALSKLVRECFGSMGLEPELMRQLWGNTNVNILEQRIEEARALLGISASGEPAGKP